MWPSFRQLNLQLQGSRLPVSASSAKIGREIAAAVFRSEGWSFCTKLAVLAVDRYCKSTIDQHAPNSLTPDKAPVVLCKANPMLLNRVDQTLVLTCTQKYFD
jgi:hypothetical protein